MEPVLDFFLQTGMSRSVALPISYAAVALAVILAAVLSVRIVRNFLIRPIIHYIRHSKYQWDDPMIESGFFDRAAWFAPLAILYLAQDVLLPQEIGLALFLRRMLFCGFVIVSVRSITSLIKSINSIYRTVRPGGATIRGYTDAAQILTYVFGAILLIAVLTGRSPWGLLSVLGGLTAVTLLIFKDMILGFVASIQLSGTDMVRIGDWIEMPSHGADGDVIDISIHCVRVQNWDKTISTIPTHALTANAFKNWRGMSESGGRRIKRPVHIDMNSIRFVTDQELEQWSKINLISDYIKSKQQEIAEYNRLHEVDDTMLINGRRQTNIGVFRAYIVAYLRSHPKINQDMTFLVRHLNPDEHGLPIEIYVFSNDKVWANYEAIQADIFDHLLAGLSTFGLRVFQAPSGYDFSHLGEMTASGKISAP